MRSSVLTISPLYGPILVSFGMNSLANIPFPAFLMEDNFTVTCDGTGILVKAFDASSQPCVSSRGSRGPCTGH